jgi:hypothetical protein
MGDRTLTREALMGFYSFLYSEEMRHAEDITKIVRMRRKLEEEQKFTLVELHVMRVRATRYIDF